MIKNLKSMLQGFLFAFIAIGTLPYLLIQSFLDL